MKNILLTISASCAVFGVVCGVAAISDARGAQEMTSRQLSNALLCALIVPHLGAVPLAAASRMD